MLISHQHRFIFIKTIKTAGTSVEAFFEPLCTVPGHRVEHYTNTLISPYGVVGRRGPHGKLLDKGYYNHMPAEEIRNKFSDYDHYRRFSVVRDPYECAISFFHFRGLQTDELEGLSVQTARQLMKSGNIDSLRNHFWDFLRRFGVPDEQSRLCINGELSINRWLRFESLINDLGSLVEDWGLPLPSDKESISFNLPRFKVLRQPSEEHPCIELNAYFSAQAVGFINKANAWSFQTFGYKMYDSNAYPIIGQHSKQL